MDKNLAEQIKEIIEDYHGEINSLATRQKICFELTTKLPPNRFYDISTPDEIERGGLSFGVYDNNGHVFDVRYAHNYYSTE